MNEKIHSFLVIALLSGGAILFAGCTNPPSAGERTARQQLQQTGQDLQVGATRPALPVIGPEATEADYVRFALLNHPAVVAAYHDWRAGVEAVAPTRALPDPQFTFEADVADTLMTFMPGLMYNFMGAGKRAAMADEAVASAGIARRAYIETVLSTAAEVRRAWVELAYVEEVGRLYASTIHAVDEALALTNAGYATGRGMANFDRQVQLQNLAAQHHAHHAGVADRLVAGRARFKSALGLQPDDADPVWPHPSLAATPLPGTDELWRRARATNPGLEKMRAMVEMAVAGAETAQMTGRPDFSLGAMVDLRANPVFVRPTATLALPIWREKIAATIAAAQARRDAAVARVDAEQLNVAAELARMLYMVRESDRMLAYIDGTALPNFERSYATLAAGVQAGMTEPAMISETRMMAIDMRHERLELLRQRETTAVDLALLIADVAPPGAPLPAATTARADSPP